MTNDVSIPNFDQFVNQLNAPKGNYIQAAQGELAPYDNRKAVIASDGNPFDRYKDVKIPDSPISYGGGVAESLLNDNEVPDRVKEEFWFIFHKDNVLGFLDEERKRSKMLNFDITRIDILNSTPYYDYDFELEKNLNVLRNVLETKLDRSLGIKGNIKNERITLQTQFSEQRQISEMGQSNIREGFWKKMLGRR